MIKMNADDLKPEHLCLDILAALIVSLISTGMAAYQFLSDWQCQLQFLILELLQTESHMCA